MREVLRVSDVRFARARTDLRAQGLIGWVCCVLDGEFRLDGLAVRRLENGGTAISFPARVDSTGKKHAYFTPCSDELRAEIEAQLLTELRRGGWIA